MFFTNLVSAETLHIATASNFKPALEKLVDEFKKLTSHSAIISSASTGKLYAQIKHGAPYDIFLSADSARPQKLVLDGLAAQDSLRTYVYGRLVFISNIKKQQVPCLEHIYLGQVNRIAIANPSTAPYGLAAKQTLEHIHAWDKVKNKIVRGDNISHAAQFVDTQNAQVGFIAKSQYAHFDQKTTCSFDVPLSMHLPIEQKMVVLKRARTKLSVKSFTEFLKSAAAQKIVKQFGYLK